MALELPPNDLVPSFKAQPLPDGIRLEGLTAIVTGSNVGLGFEAAKELASHGLSKLIPAVRDLAKGDATKTEIAQVAPECNIQRLEFTRSPTGYKAHIQISYLGTALLSLLVVEPLKRTAGRMTITASSVAFGGNRGILAWLDDPTSFLLDVLWTKALAARLDPAHIIVNTLNPGDCRSSFHRVSPRVEMFSKYLAWSSAEGGYHLTDAVVRHPDSHGAYLSE
ncbi:NAD(P)-binding protein [Hypoxylon sp. EC38]|nr:NAD(P)-binding protein [Hypoxylon sp. EC38]